jgi:antitoxin component YwqK of YwqJK toxin-antitoxin module
MEHLYYRSDALYCVIHENKKEYFYEDGTPKTFEGYFEGRLHGESLLYWPNGQLKRKCSFIKGVRDGQDLMWNDRGLLVDEGRYDMGKPAGVHRRFNEKGSMIEEIEYLEGPRFNLRSWDDAGEIRVEAIWIDADTYLEKVWDRFQNIWVEKEGFWNGKKLVYV